MKRALWVLLATLIGVVVTARLGIWQLQRAAQKEALQHAFDERAGLPELPLAALEADADEVDALHYRRARLTGRWVSRFTIFLDNRQMNGRPGFFVVTPLQLADSRVAVLVQRGWVPRDAADRTRLPMLATPSGEVSVVGHIAPPPARLYEFSAAASGPIRQNLDLAAYSRETGLRLAPLSLVQDDAGAGANDGLARQWSPPAVDVQKHYGYAFQWFALCALMTGLYVWFQLVGPWLKRRA
ncbi:MAG: SURF1 family protein [Betaproteobacteria bacterium]|nr:MAG: SURF1 family protein [Betaproteobacteria bacterium]